MPVAGRSRMPSWHPLSACPLRFGILPALAPIARLPGTGSPSLVIRDAFRKPNRVSDGDRVVAPLGTAHARCRTFAAPILGFAHSVLTRFGILPSLVSKRRLPGTGSPSLVSVTHSGSPIA